LRTQVLASSPEDAARLEAAAEAIDEILSRWAVATERKAIAELPHRLNLWQAWLEELHEGTSGPGGYAQQVRNRVIAERLRSLVRTDAPAHLQRLQALDQQLRAAFEPGEFVWEPGLAPAYPQPEFWFLYGGVRPPSR